LALYKSFTYLLTYLLTTFLHDGNRIAPNRWPVLCVVGGAVGWWICMATDRWPIMCPGAVCMQ